MEFNFTVFDFHIKISCKKIILMIFFIQWYIVLMTFIFLLVKKDKIPPRFLPPNSMICTLIYLINSILYNMRMLHVLHKQNLMLILL